jgi:hypothetical protein
MDDGLLKGFSTTEHGKINTINNKSILSSFDVHLKEGGTRDFYWSNIVSNVSQNYSDAYSAYTLDRVFLPNVEQLQNKMYAKGIKAAKTFNGKKTCYWLETCYFGNSSMVRVVDTDGFIFHKDANTVNIGVLPALYIKNTLE